FNVNIPLVKIFRSPTVRELAEYIKKEAPQKLYISIPPTEKKEYYILSSAQKRLYILQQMDMGNTVYNMPQIIPLPMKPEVDNGKLENTFKSLIARHQSLRTSFHMVNDQPVQKIHDEVGFEIEYFGVEQGAESLDVCCADIIRDFIGPFDLSKAPLLRVGMIKLSEEGTTSLMAGGAAAHILLVDMHHIISDGISLDLLTDEFAALYQGGELPPLRLRYNDYAQWQTSAVRENILKNQETFWLNQFKGEISLLNLPADFPRPPLQSFAGSNLGFTITAEETRDLKTLAAREDATLYMVMLSLFIVFLAKISGSEDIIIGTPIAGREHADLEKIIGMFVNTLVLRNFPIGSKSFRLFIKEVKERTLAAFENQAYQFEDLVEKIDTRRDTGRNPVFDVMFDLQARDRQPPPGLETKAHPPIAPYRYDNRISKFDMTLTVVAEGNYLLFNFEYCTKLFKKETIERFTRYFKIILSLVLKNPGSKIAEISILPEEDRKQILYHFNHTDAQYPRDKTVHQLFAEQAEKTPHRIAVSGDSRETAGKEGRKGDTTQLTYRELNQKAGQLAGWLRGKGVLPDHIVGIMIEPSIEMSIALLGVLMAGGGYMPISPDYPEERINYMLTDSNARVLLSEVSEVLDLSLPPASLASPSNLAYVIYTSGSTGRPKGVLVEHRSLVNYVFAFLREFVLFPTDTMLQQASFTFDAFAEEFFPILLTGGKLFIPAEIEVKDIYRLSPIIVKHDVTLISASPLLLNELNKIDRFPSLRIYISGADVLKWHYIDNLLETGVIYNTYGPTETVVCATYYKCREQTFSNVPIGKPITNYRVYITDKQERLQPIGVPGELCISGPGVARGYLNKPELTAEKFVFYRSHSPKKIYKTGDLARWLPDGNIEFLGRLDYQVKIRGYRIETGEIENCLLNEEDISEAVVIDREDREGHKYLCAYIVSGKKCNLAELRHKLSKKLPDYMVPGYFMQLDNIPLSPEGKINRRALRALPPPEMRAVQGVVPPRDKIEKTLVELWSHVLDIQEEKIGIDAEFFQLGGHSLKAVTLLSRIHKELNVNIPLTEIFKTPTIRGLRAYIREAANDQYVSIRIAEKREYYHLSSAQKRLYMLHHMEEQNITYNMPQIIPLPLEIDKKKLENTFRKLIWRHESLRTSFFMIKSEPVQMIHDRVEFEIEQHTPAPAGRPPQEGNSLALRNPLPGGGPGDWSGLEQFIRPFDLSKAPLLRVGLIHFPPLTVEPGEHSIQEGIPGHKHILLVDMHHIISDGISHGILEHEFMALSRDEELPSLPIQYKDFSHWQNSTREKENIKQQQEYWLREFEGEIPVLDLPIDYPRPTVQNFEGAVLDFEVSGDHTRTLKAIALAGGSTLYMILLTLINILLSKLSGQEDIIIGTPIAGRRHADLEKIIGMFVNTLALRNFPRREKSLNEFFKEVTQRTLSAFENQEYPFEDLVEKVNVARDAARNPVFDVMIVFQNIDIGIAQDSHPGKRKVEIPSSSQEYSYENKTAKFDLTLTLTEFPGKLLGSLNYCIRLFKPKTSERFIGYFKRIISQVCENERLRLADIEIISPDEKTQILIDFNQTEASYPRRKTIHQLFAQQVEKSGDGVAIVCLERSAGSVEFVGDGTVHLTYGGLNRKSNQLAQLLGEKGIMPGELVGILVDRSPEMIIGILGILKAGAGYVPLNPAAPTARTKYMAEECDVKIGLTLSPLLDEDNIPFENYLYIDEYHHYANMSEADPARNAVPGDWAYVIFTSGSTGKPKGVPIAHANLSPLLHWGYRHLGLGIKDRTIQNLSYYFDWSVWEIFITLTTGSGLYIVPEDLQLNPGVCINLINKQGITVLHATPSHYRYFANMGLPLETLKYLFLGAEKLTQDLVQRSFESVSPNCRVFNMYGPTECTIITNVLEIHQEDNNKFQYLSSVPIGGPAANFNLLVLDKSLNVCPVNITGEMYIGGDGVAEGYLNRPELTAEKFVSVSYKSYRAYRAYISRKIYKTGDLVRWLSDGNIEFLGRIDFQVKIRGFRIELGEIEKQLTGHPAIKETVVLVLGEEQQEKFLCAYVILNNDKEKLFDETPGIPGELNAYLSQTLPDYMIPSHFIPIQKIPLTPNGKLDRRALPLPEAQSPLSGKYVPPANEIEKQLAAIWAEVLARDPLHAPIGIDDDFFELGGHSLKATVLTTKILEEFNLRVPLVEIFKSPTIRKLTGYIKHSHRDLVWEKDENIVLIRKKSDNAGHLFFVHDGSGEIEAYIEFCNHLKEEFNCWGIKAEKPTTAAPQNVTIEEVAAKYTEKIKRIQPHGPYHIAGWSIGGTIAFEMIRQLERNGENIKFLAVIDAPAPPKDLPAGGSGFTVESELGFVQPYLKDKEIIGKLKKVSDISHFWSLFVGYLESSSLNDSDLTEKVRQVITEYEAHVVPDYHQLSIGQLIRYLNLGRTFRNARALYSPDEKINVPIYYFGASQSKGTIKKDNWNDYSRNPITFCEVTGDHFSIFKVPQVVELAKAFGRIVK
ncbi:MAG: amino acid adenylation domain-containing protein, partial [Candidatus Aminicenantes bacterium]|nr:amino acid adenylation domain-containing protein [Candidatus Aminicenantes bacterium]NIM83466.1 amino acid adenylation domain-containing protein [Candidatus Aminicenantes bacterium]NIN22858.1 amino acid adenylation domain-containing protein [Candidatus Aminicenantes bacterium]NIN46594.1 amino acid adenylation domain-containing protein [Candidatus Aminicenantes bacterium]NIN89497.1 amino acid adenylation domain-containing protein [Candidatus Aminicenantes bacterium]